jgi:tetratricopeptide (TPR) repeat protein
MNEERKSAQRPSGVPVELQRIVSLANSGDLAGAGAAAKSLRDGSMAREAWRVIAGVNANLQRFDAALHAIDSALHFDPGSPPLRLERALLLERAGRASESCAALEALAAAGPGFPELLGHLGRALRYAGRDAEAEERVSAALDRWPDDAGLHRLLAELRWNRGADTTFVARLEQAIAQLPQALHLRLVAADLLRGAGAPQRGLEMLEEGLRRAPGAAAFEASIGALLGDLDRPHDAVRFLRSAAARLPDSVQMRRNLVPALLRAGAFVEARDICDALLGATPDDQLLIAYRAAALRMTGDPRYSQLQDYGRLVRSYLPEPPAGYADIAAFNAALARELGSLHGAARRPLSQSIRGGIQTERNLPAHDPVIRDFFALIDAPIRDYIDRLDTQSAHPTDRRRLTNYRIAGSWSVQLQPGGFHTNHVHPQGWISSAYYVELPPEADAATRAGWLKFGELSPAIAGCGADLHVRPRAGMLVLFPSFMWHGTVPFQNGARRLTAAFDVLPA